MTRPARLARDFEAAEIEIIAESRRNGVTFSELTETHGANEATIRKALAAAGHDDCLAALIRNTGDFWDRPCSQCGSTERRRRHLFRCGACRRDAGLLADGQELHVALGGDR